MLGLTADTGGVKSKGRFMNSSLYLYLKSPASSLGRCGALSGFLPGEVSSQQ